MKIAEPIINKIADNTESLRCFQDKVMNSENEKNKDLILHYPVTYLHCWENKGRYEVYVGESNNIIKRTKQHLQVTDKNKWQYHLAKKNADLYVISHEHFNKSLTLDIENRLIQYLLGTDIPRVYNKYSNPQYQYYTSEEFDVIFNKIWHQLRKQDPKLFPLESHIKDSAIFKASPLHKLTDDQQQAKDLILERIYVALKEKDKKHFIFIEGESGTGKTVLNSSTFYELYRKIVDQGSEDITCLTKTDFDGFLLVANREQIKVYRQIFKKLGVTNKENEIVLDPTRFINRHLPEKSVDFVFIDEAHLLLTQGRQAYRGKNQLEDILKRAKVVVIMFDEEQILNREQYLDVEKIMEYRKIAQKNNNYIKLEQQLRMQVNDDVLDWINSFTREGIIKKMPKDLGNYDIKIFDDVKDLDRAIERKANGKKSRLSRIIATYDWPYNMNSHKGCPSKYWEVRIGDWHKPWNRELDYNLSKSEKMKLKDVAWVEQPQTINEVGSTYTIHGFDLNYSGVIIGPSVKYRDQRIVFDPSASCNIKAVQRRKVSDGTFKKFGKLFLKHELRVLMTRGVNGLYIYACDDALRKALKECMKTE